MILEFWGVSQLGWQAVAALTGAATLGVAATAAVVAFFQFRANQQTRDEQSRPYLIADFEPSEAGIVLSDFVVRNIGKTPALAVQVRMSPTPERARETTAFPLSKSRLLSGTLPMVAPGRELRLFFDSMPERYEAKAVMSFEVRITYKNSTGEKFDEVSTVDMDSGRGSLQTTIYGLHHAAKALRSIDSKLDAVNRNLKNPIQVTIEELSTYQERVARGREEAVRQYEEIRAQVLPAETADEPPKDVAS